MSVAMINIEGAASPPTEGDGTGTAAVLRLTTNPTTATLAESVAVSVAIVTGGSETATGEINYLQSGNFHVILFRVSFFRWFQL